MNALLLDHLWQSTLVAGAAGLLTLTLRKNRAAIRYWLWFAASMKFLIPFSVLVAVGGALFHPVMSEPQSVYDMQTVVQPFSIVTPALAVPSSASWDWAAIAWTTWALGFATILAVWLVRWSRLRWVLRRAEVLSLDTPIPVSASATSQEPGLVGIWRPVVVLPEGILETLSPAEMQAIIAHELCHYRRRDNLTATLHMAVEALFWFHPLVWWISARLVQERENACDESVVASGNDPETYAESILKVCKHYVRSPLTCAAGISGADLEKRMEAIIGSEIVIGLNAFQKSLLVTCAAVTTATPLLLSMMIAPPVALRVDGISKFVVSSTLIDGNKNVPQVFQSKNTNVKNAAEQQNHANPNYAINHEAASTEPNRINSVKIGRKLPRASQSRQPATRIADSAPDQTNGNERTGHETEGVSPEQSDAVKISSTESLSISSPSALLPPLPNHASAAPILAAAAATTPSASGPVASPILTAKIEPSQSTELNAKKIAELALTTAIKEQWPVISGLGAAESINIKSVDTMGMIIFDVKFEHRQTEWTIPVNGRVSDLKVRRLDPGLADAHPNFFASETEGESGSAIGRWFAPYDLR